MNNRKVTVLTQQQQDQFWTDGVLTVKDAVTPELLFKLRAQFDQWVKESRNQDASFFEQQADTKEKSTI